MQLSKTGKSNALRFAGQADRLLERWMAATMAMAMAVAAAAAAAAAAVAVVGKRHYRVAV